jgi:hypothetical protein
MNWELLPKKSHVQLMTSRIPRSPSTCGVDVFFGQVDEDCEYSVFEVLFKSIHGVYP